MQTNENELDDCVTQVTSFLGYLPSGLEKEIDAAIASAGCGDKDSYEYHTKIIRQTTSNVLHSDNETPPSDTAA